MVGAVEGSRDETDETLDAVARRALDVAEGMAAVTGDERCGTEHLLFGLVATAEGDVSEIARLFALDRLRVERAVHLLREQSCDMTRPPSAVVARSPRLTLALESGGGGRLAPAHLLTAILTDARSGACACLRLLGVRPGEVRRLAEVAAAGLGHGDIESLIAALDRRTDLHRPWWGPAPAEPVRALPLPGGGPVELARSASAVGRLSGLVVGGEGLGFTLTVESLPEAPASSWLLAPRWQPREVLVPGDGARERLDPELVIVAVGDPAGPRVTNHRLRHRFVHEAPTGGALVLLGHTSAVERRNDRRCPTRRVEVSDWWVWPLPRRGEIRIGLSWSAEALTGSVRLDAVLLGEHASRLVGR